jgi:hypothetical protein
MYRSWNKDRQILFRGIKERNKESFHHSCFARFTPQPLSTNPAKGVFAVFVRKGLRSGFPDRRLQAKIMTGAGPPPSCMQGILTLHSQPRIPLGGGSFFPSVHSSWSLVKQH